MSRAAKQAAYGIFFLAFWIIVGWGAYFAFLKPAPSCSDRMQNQGEAGVDCGGPCANICLPTSLRSLEHLGPALVFHPGTDLLALLVQIQNANPSVAARDFEYRLDLFDSGGSLIHSLQGRSFIYAEEIKYLAQFWEDPRASRVRRAEVVFSDPEWTEKDAFPRPVVLIQNHETQALGNRLEVRGRIVNRDTVPFPQISVMAILRTPAGVPAGVSEAVLLNVFPGESRPFTVLHPSAPGADHAKTEVLTFARRP